MRYDSIVIGTGPAGLEAAITLKIRNKNVLVLGSKHSSEKVVKSHTIDNYLGIPHIAGADLARTFLDHAISMGVEIEEYRVNAVYSMGDYFAVSASDEGGEKMLEASTVILATGVVQTKPLPNEDALLGRGVSYCATCDAALYKGKSAIVVSYSSEYEPEADFLAERAEKVFYIPMYKAKSSDAINNTDTNEALSSLQSQDAGTGISFRQKNIEIIPNVKPVSVSQTEDKKMSLMTDKGQITADGIFILRNAVAPDKLVPGLLLDGSHIKVDRKMATNLPGLFAAGDVTGTPYQLTKAAGEGNVAALSAVEYLS